MAGNGNGNGDRRRREAWRLTKEKTLMFSGLAVIFYSLVATTTFDQTFHFEYLIAGLALCGISIAQWGDKEDKK